MSCNLKCFYVENHLGFYVRSNISDKGCVAEAVVALFRMDSVSHKSMTPSIVCSNCVTKSIDIIRLNILKYTRVSI